MANAFEDALCTRGTDACIHAPTWQRPHQVNYTLKFTWRVYIYTYIYIQTYIYWYLYVYIRTYILMRRISILNLHIQLANLAVATTTQLHTQIYRTCVCTCILSYIYIRLCICVHIFDIYIQNQHIKSAHSTCSTYCNSTTHTDLHYTYILICICIHLHTYICIYKYTFIYIHVYIYT